MLGLGKLFLTGDFNINFLEESASKQCFINSLRERSRPRPLPIFSWIQILKCQLM